MAINIASGYATFLQEASSLQEHESGRRIIIQTHTGTNADGVAIPLWIFRIPDAAVESLDMAAAMFGAFCEPGTAPRCASLVVPFYKRYSMSGELGHRSESFLLVASRSLSSAPDTKDEDNVPSSSARMKSRGIGMLWRFFLGRGKDKRRSECSYESFSKDGVVFASSHLYKSAWRALVVILMAICVLLIVLGGINTRRPTTRILRSGAHDSESVAIAWHRYHTGTSIGPKNQLRIQWHNASEWGRLNAHQNGEWEFRIDDQALIPAHMLDNDERDRQMYFRARYPHMAAVVDASDYIRPAWLGSKSILIEWDSTFHDGHCILALRRYFKAKETGRHVCPRDIDPAHILHCLNTLEKSILKSGPMSRHSPPSYMYWETKVCF
ncbi:hypothetical protein MAA_11158 [Metarhizium robertsii ARSEF 23]|nr:uncharacterized protein MAA_11158 [Metarhizium robertsii ARSEF 23]KHO11343.1 hypothetical protein MAA_11158 [Metarhizium robertsii ARSEF 23]